MLRLRTLLMLTSQQLLISRCLSVLQKDEFLRLIINSVRNDLICRNEAFQCLALNFIGSGAPSAILQLRCI